jgi:hypothetical protein
MAVAGGQIGGQSFSRRIPAPAAAALSRAMLGHDRFSVMELQVEKQSPAFSILDSLIC